MYFVQDVDVTTIFYILQKGEFQKKIFWQSLLASLINLVVSDGKNEGERF